MFRYLLLICKFFIWVQRNDWRFRSVRPSTVKLLAAMRACASLYLPLFAKRFRSPRHHRFLSGNGERVGMWVLFVVTHSLSPFKPLFVFFGF